MRVILVTTVEMEVHVILVATGEMASHMSAVGVAQEVVVARVVVVGPGWLT